MAVSMMKMNERPASCLDVNIAYRVFKRWSRIYWAIAIHAINHLYLYKLCHEKAAWMFTSKRHNSAFNAQTIRLTVWPLTFHVRCVTLSISDLIIPELTICSSKSDEPQILTWCSTPFFCQCALLFFPDSD